MPPSDEKLEVMSAHRKGVIYRPASGQTSAYRIVGDTKLFSPFRKNEGFAAKRNKAISARVAGLFLLGCPSAIAWFVIAVVVNSIKRCIRWSRPHIREEIVEATPAFTHRYSAPAVFMKAGSFWIGAPGFHRGPRVVFPRVEDSIFVVRRHEDILPLVSL